MSLLVLMRHGQASFGADAYDSLSELGHAQAWAAGAWLRERGVRPTALVHGPRQRHADTMRGLLDGAELTVDVRMMSGLDEFGEGEEVLAAAAQLFGRPMSGSQAPSRREQLLCYDEAVAAWVAGTVALPGRQPFTSFRQQVRRWLDDLTRDAERVSGCQVLAVTSAGVVSAAVCEVLGLPDRQWHPLLRMIQNASFTEIVFSRGQFGLRSFNGVGHLPAALVSSI